MAGSQRITVLQHISHEASEGEKWQVNDVANISNKLLMSSFYASVDNKLYVSIYSAERQEVQEMHNIEISTQTEPHAVLLTKDGNTIVVCVGMNIQFYKVGNGKILNTVVLQKEPSCICRWKDVLLVATGNSSTIQTFYFNAFQAKQLVLQGLDQSDYPTDMTMVGDVIYLCTKKYGQALSYDQYGVKLSAYKRNDEQTSKANSIAVHREKRLVFILWNKCNVLVYSHLSNEILFSVDTTCSTKVRLNDDYMMITKVPANNEVLIYDVETLIDFAVLKKEFLATLKKKARDEILTDRKPHDPCQNQTSTKSSDQSVFKTTYSGRKQIKRQQQKKLLKLFDELQIKYANDNAKQETTGGLAEQVQTETPTDFALLKKEYLATLREIKPHQQNMLKLFDELQRKYENYNANIGTKERQLYESKSAESALEKSEKTKLAPEKEIVDKDTRLLEEERKIEGQKTSLLSSSEMMKEQEDKSTELKGPQKILKEILEQVKEKSTREERSSDQAESALEKSEKTKLAPEKEIEDKDTRLLEEERKIEGQKTSLLSSSEMIREQEDMKRELKGQQKILEEILVQVKEELNGEERSSDQVLTNLRKVEEMSKKLDDEVTQLKERLLAEGKRAKEVITSTIKLSEEMKGLESTRTELVSQQQKLKDDFIQGRKDNINREERSRVQIVTRLKKFVEEHTKLKDGLTQLKESLPAEENTAKEVQTSSVKVYATQKELEHMNIKVERQSEHLNELLSTSKREASPQGMLTRFLSDAQLDKPKCQRDTASYGKDELESVVAESVDTGIYTSNSTSTSHFENPFVRNGEQLNPDLKVAVTVTVKGAHMHIPDTGVELDIPKGAIRQKRLIEMTIIPFEKQFAPIEKFSSNASVVVELLPNKAIFDMPVHLKLPHCLQLKKNYKEITNHVKVFVSHHEAGPPAWKEDSSAKCTLEEDHCVIRLKQFCWVKYEINDKIVVAKRLKVFTAGRSLRPNDSIAEIEVGYYMDLPGRAENMTASLVMEFCQSKPFLFVKEGELSLQLVLSKIVPKEWTYITPDENPKTISYKSVADDKDTSCPFALEKSSSSERKPYCIFKIVQGNESVELSMRF